MRETVSNVTKQSISSIEIPLLKEGQQFTLQDAICLIDFHRSTYSQEIDTFYELCKDEQENQILKTLDDKVKEELSKRGIFEKLTQKCLSKMGCQTPFKELSNQDLIILIVTTIEKLGSWEESSIGLKLKDREELEYNRQVLLSLKDQLLNKLITQNFKKLIKLYLKELLGSFLSDKIGEEWKKYHSQKLLEGIELSEFELQKQFLGESKEQIFEQLNEQILKELGKGEFKEWFEQQILKLVEGVRLNKQFFIELDKIEPKEFRKFYSEEFVKSQKQSLKSNNIDPSGINNYLKTDYLKDLIVRFCQVEESNLEEFKDLLLKNGREREGENFNYNLEKQLLDSKFRETDLIFLKEGYLKNVRNDIFSLFPNLTLVEQDNQDFNELAYQVIQQVSKLGYDEELRQQILIEFNSELLEEFRKSNLKSFEEDFKKFKRYKKLSDEEFEEELRKKEFQEYIENDSTIEDCIEYRKQLLRELDKFNLELRDSLLYPKKAVKSEISKYLGFVILFFIRLEKYKELSAQVLKESNKEFFKEIGSLWLQRLVNKLHTQFSVKFIVKKFLNDQGINEYQWLTKVLSREKLFEILSSWCVGTLLEKIEDLDEELILNPNEITAQCTLAIRELCHGELNQKLSINQRNLESFRNLFLLNLDQRETWTVEEVLSLLSNQAKLDVDEKVKSFFDFSKWCLKKIGLTLTEEDIQYLRDNKAMISQNIKVWYTLYELSYLREIKEEIEDNQCKSRIDKKISLLRELNIQSLLEKNSSMTEEEIKYLDNRYKEFLDKKVEDGFTEDERKGYINCYKEICEVESKKLMETDLENIKEQNNKFISGKLNKIIDKLEGKKPRWSRLNWWAIELILPLLIVIILVFFSIMIFLQYLYQ